MVCNKPILETTEVWTFYEKHPAQPFYRFERVAEGVYNEAIGIGEEEYHSGYQTFCIGDSGSGNWVQQNGGRFKYVLVGINSIASNICGYYGLMEKINNKESINWIKTQL